MVYGSKVGRLDSRSRWDEFAALVETSLPVLQRRIEVLALYGMVSTFWGLVVYVALVYGLQ